jgi:ribosomal protein L11 methyltransferase
VIYKEVKINIDKDFEPDLSQFLETLSLPGFYEMLFDSSIPKEEDSILRQNTVIRAYLNSDDSISEIKILIYLKSICPDSFTIESRMIETREYEEAYKEFYKPFQVGGVWIVPIWEKESDIVKQALANQQIVLFLNPGVAFGTGHHETTQMIVERLQEITITGKKILDLGTGSGILSLLCGLLGAERIFSLDIDPNAVKATLSNWKENIYPLPTILEAVESGFDHERVSSDLYDLTIANITFAVLSQNILQLSKIHCNHFLFSGVITEKKDSFLDLLKINLPGKLVHSKSKNGWELIEWHRDSANL